MMNSSNSTNSFPFSNSDSIQSDLSTIASNNNSGVSSGVSSFSNIKSILDAEDSTVDKQLDAFFDMFHSIPESNIDSKNSIVESILPISRNNQLNYEFWFSLHQQFKFELHNAISNLTDKDLQVIPLIDYWLILSNEEIDLEYGIILCIQQCCERSHQTVICDAMIKNFVSKLIELSEINSNALNIIATNQIESDFEFDNLNTAIAVTMPPNLTVFGFQKKEYNYLLCYFILFAISDQSDAAYNIINQACMETQQLIDTILVHAYDSSDKICETKLKYNDKKILIRHSKLMILQIISELQIIMSLLNYSLCQLDSHSIFAHQTNGDNRQVDQIVSKATNLLINLTKNHRSLTSTISLVVRNGLFIVSNGERYDIVKTILSIDPLQMSTNNVNNKESNNGNKDNKNHNNANNILIDERNKDHQNISKKGEEYLHYLTERIENITLGNIHNNTHNNDFHSFHIPTNDIGYKHLHRINKDQANKPCGSFIIRPHQTEVTIKTETMTESHDMLCVSFKGNASEGVKHAIIRREECEIIEKSKTHVSKMGINDNRVNYRYQCGKIGPCDSLVTTLTEISKILTHELLIDLPISALEVNNHVSFQSRIYSPADSMRLLDLNTRLWNVCRGLLPQWKKTLLNVDYSHYQKFFELSFESEHDDEDDHNYYYSQNNNDIHDDNLLNENYNNRIVEWTFRDPCKNVAGLVEKITTFMSLKEHIHQIEKKWNGILSKLIEYDQSQIQKFKNDDDNNTDNYYENNLIRKLHINLTHQVDCTLNISLISPTPLPSNLFYIPSTVDKILRPLPVQSNNNNNSPTASTNHPVASLSSLRQGLEINLHDSEEYLQAELFIFRILKSLNIQMVKLPGNGNGFNSSNNNTTEHTAECYDQQELKSLLETYRNLYIQSLLDDMNNRATGAISEQDNSNNLTLQDIHNDKYNKIDDNNTPTLLLSSNSTIVNTNNINSNINSNNNKDKINSAFSLQKMKSISSNMKYKLSNIMPHTSPISNTIGNINKINPQITTTIHNNTYSLFLVSNNNSNDPLSSLISHLQIINDIVEIEDTYTIKEYITHIIAWFIRLKIIVEVTKPAEYAFSSPQTYYRYLDPWEVRVMLENPAGNGRCRLGRHIYNSLSSSMQSSYLYHVKTMMNEYLRSQLIIAQNHMSDFTHEEDHEKMNEIILSHQKKRMKSVMSDIISLWELLRCESWLISLINRVKLLENDEISLGNIIPVSPNPMPVSSTPGAGAIADEENQSHLLSLSSRSNDNDNNNNYNIFQSTLQLALSTSSNHIPLSCPYFTSLSHALYKNNVHSRLYVPYRYVAYVQIDIYNLKQIIQLHTSNQPIQTNIMPNNTNNTNTSSLIDLLSVLPENYPSSSGIYSTGSHQYPSQTMILNPSTTSHSSTAIDVMSTISFTKPQAPFSENSYTYDVTMNNSSLNSSTLLSNNINTPLLNNNIINPSNPSNNKSFIDGTVLTCTHKAEPIRSSNTNPLQSQQRYQQIISYSSIHQSSSCRTVTVVASHDYIWREQIIYRYALPEGVLTPVLKSNGNIDNKTFLRPPRIITIAIFERNFFSDVKLGDVDINIEDLSENKVIRDWFPLRRGVDVSWLIYLQIKLKYQLMSIEANKNPAYSVNYRQRRSNLNEDDSASLNSDRESIASSGNNNLISQRESHQVTKKTSLLGHLEDFF
eukprot:gene4640-6521_t